MRQKAFTKSTILSSWKAAGLIPFDPDKVIAPLREKQAYGQERPGTASSTSSTSTISTWPTPKKLSDLHQYAGYLKEVGFEDEQVGRRFQRFVKGALAKAISDTEAEETLYMHKKRAALSAKLQQGTRRVVAKGGVLNAGYAVAHIEERRVKEVEGARIHARAQELPRNKRGVFKASIGCHSQV
ncbi:hypothetical protein GJ744_006557 [Endocarpon pusillum]|uniref:Uncharacterized protein n=1 Tax=Endocarpon pusillum TaxID=364733 RepID=A0A8H7EA63_9EURO|nr:hypothetical protein GJ744_006557 [Endocarpon pusillum]